VTRLVLGIGMSSKATRSEVLGLVEEVVGRADLDLEAVSLVATLRRFVGDERARLGPPIIGVDDATLLDQFPAAHRAGTGTRLAARVAEGCALTAAGAGAQLLVGTTRSAHATAALAIARLT